MRLLNVDEMKFENIDMIEFDKKYKLHDFDTTEPFWKKHLPEVKKEENEIEK